MNKFKKYLKLFIFTICAGFLCYKFSESYSDFVSKKIQLGIFEIFFLFFFYVIFLNIINLRGFLFAKFSIGYAYRYSDWSKLYFESLLINSVIFLSGPVYRAIQLKKKRCKLY